MRLQLFKLLFFIIIILHACSNNKNTSNKGDEKKQDTVRVLPIKGAYNVRDLGGYPTADGKRVKWRKVFRAGDLAFLTEEDLNYFSSIPITTLIDFRDSLELKTSPARKPESVKNVYNLPINPDIIKFSQMKNSDEKSDSSVLIEANKFLIRNGQQTYGDFFQILMNEENAPLLFYSMSGKTRSGLAAALFLASLGVDKDTIIKDYMLSEGNENESYLDEVMKHPEFTSVFSIQQKNMRIVFEVIDAEYGGINNYLTNNLGVDLEKMKAIYTE